MNLDLREWMAAVDARGELRRLNGVDWDLEMGVLTEILAERWGPALLFDEIPGYERGKRVLSNALASVRQLAFTFAMDETVSPLEFVRQFKDKLKILRPQKPVEVKGGPVMENVAEGADIDLFRFPVPKWHEHDGGRYIGTGDVVILRDPDTGWVNAAPYRVQIHEPSLAGIFMAPGNHGSLIRRKYWSRGEACPVVVVAGLHPLIWAVASMKLAEGASELDAAGGFLGRPLEVIRGVHTGLPIPAEAEIVIEGQVPPVSHRFHREAPFGEFTGYYTFSDERGPVIEVKRLMWRNDPILLGAPPIRPPGGNRLHDFLPAAQLWKRLEDKRVAGLRGVWIMPAGVSGFITVISIDQAYEGHAKEVARTAIEVGGLGRFLVIVDSDIDPSNEQEVLWALATRCEPQDSIEITGGCRSTLLDPLIVPGKRDPGEQLTGSRAVLLSCKPFSWRERFPIVNRFNEELRRSVLEKWAAYF